MSTAAEPLYKLFPRYRPRAVELGAGGNRLLAITGGSMCLLAAVFSLAPVVRATGLSRTQVVTLFALYFACMVVNDHVLHPLAMRSRAGFVAQLVITPGYNVVFLALFVILPGDPRTPLWLGFLLYTCVTAAWQEIDASLWLLALHTLGPLFTIPFFIAAGADPTWSVAGPVICSVMCLVAYHLGATTSHAWRSMRVEQSAAIERLRARNAELERERIAQDLHDSVGSSLSIFGLSADLVEQHVQHPEMLLSIASSLRDASKEGLSELRGVLDGLAPVGSTSTALGQALTRSASRISTSSGREVRVSVAAGPALEIDGPVRMATLRIFQESVNNAIRHADAQRIEIQLCVDHGKLSMQIVNDGASWTRDSATQQHAGRGLSGMQARAAALGGSCGVSSLPDARTRVTLELPLLAGEPI